MKYPLSDDMTKLHLTNSLVRMCLQTSTDHNLSYLMALEGLVVILAEGKDMLQNELITSLASKGGENEC